MNAPNDDWSAASLLDRELPDCALLATRGEPTSLLRVSGRSVVFVYPWTGRPGHSNPPGWDDIPGAHGSTPQAQAYARHHGSFVQLSTRIFGLSLQASEWQREFARRMALPYPLLSDESRQFTAPLMLPTFQTGGTDYLRRLTMVVLDGRVADVRYPVDRPERDAEDTLLLIASR